MTQQLSVINPQTVINTNSNDGQVKVNTGNGLKPRFDNTSILSINGMWQKLVYDSPLGLSGSPTTSWPANIPTPTDNDIYDFVNDTFIENTVSGQINFWRLQFDYAKSSTQSVIEIRIRNTLSGFILNTFVTFVAGQTAGNFSVLMVTIADGASLPPPFGVGQGYNIEVMADDNSFQSGAGDFLELESLVRINAQYAALHY